MGLIALWFAKMRGTQSSPRAKELENALHRLPMMVGQTLSACSQQIKSIASNFKDAEHMFVIGKGFAEPIAKEGSLKIKEITYIHAEGYSGGALKHGPFALIENENGKFGATPIILLIFDDEHAHHMRIVAEE